MSSYEMETEFAESFGDYTPEYADYSEYSEYSPEANGRRPYKAPRQPRPGGGGYTRAPAVPAAVTHEHLARALARVKQHIDLVANGVKANNANLNDFVGRTGRNFNRLREEQRREIARLDQSVAGARDLGVLGAVLAGGDKSEVVLPLLVVAMDQQSQQTVQAGGATPAQPGGLLGSGNNTSLILALAVSGMFK